MAKILCFGNVQFDVLCRTVTALPPPGIIDKIENIDFALSGNAANVAAVLARLGMSVELAGYSGADVIGEQFRTTLTTLGIQIDKLTRHPSAGTGTSIITLAPNGERSIFFVNGVNELFELDTVPDEWLAGKQIVSVGSVFVLPQFTATAVAKLFTRAKAQGSTTVLNICWDEEYKGLHYLEPALAVTDYFILSIDEGRNLTKHTQELPILQAVQACTSGKVILTLGADGCCFLAPEQTDQIQYIPALPVHAVDCTGAGDSFVAGFIAGIQEGRSVEQSAHLGCQVASYAVTGPGSYPRVPALAEIDRIHTH